MGFIAEDETETFESMKEEALKRMRILGLAKDVIISYEDNNRLCCSENGQITNVPEKIIKEIGEWQDNFGNLIYHVIHSNFIFETYECLSVSCYKEDWDYEEKLINDMWVMSHSINVTVPEYTESGSICIRNVKGILTRVM